MTVAISSAAFAQAYPDRPIRLIVSYPPGGGTDVTARTIVGKFSEGLGKQVVIDNRPGAGSMIGTDLVAKATPDGYTLLMSDTTFGIVPGLYAKVPYDTLRDFEPVTQITSVPVGLVVHPGVPARSVKELVALAKAKPGSLNYGSAGVASLAHLATALLASMAGIDLMHVPYKSSAQSVTDMITGRLDMQLATIGPTLPTIRAGQLRALVTSGGRRASVLPEVPTVAEAGIAGYEASLWIAMVAPAATPPAIIARLNREVNQVLNSAEAKDALVAQGLEAEPGPPQAVTERTRSDTAKWRGVVAKAGIKAE
jgi:tripartite-type tricarboxylate transporter receptor subunit TctC